MGASVHASQMNEAVIHTMTYWLACWNILLPCSQAQASKGAGLSLVGLVGGGEDLLQQELERRSQQHQHQHQQQEGQQGQQQKQEPQQRQAEGQ